MARGIEKGDIFLDDRDRGDFLDRLASVVERTGLEVHAWALLTNHVHLLVRTGAVPLERVMRILLTGYAIYFNRRHRRVGHLFQNRFKSIVCDENGYYLELVRYIHLNPLRSGVVTTIAELAEYPYCGHAAIIGTVPRPWQATGSVIRQFDARDGVPAYEDFMAAGVAHGKRPELTGGGLVRSAGGWHAVKSLRRGREAFAADERVLGSSTFVEKLLTEIGALKARNEEQELERIVAAVCRAIGIERADVFVGSRTARIVRAREGICYLWLRLGGRSRALVRHLGIARSTVHRRAADARAQAEWWNAALDGPADPEKRNNATNVP